MMKKIEMNLNQAINVLFQATANVKLDRKEHELVNTAFDVLQKLIEESKKVEIQTLQKEPML